MAKNSESKVVSIVRAYRQQLDQNERSMLYDLAGKWQLVQDSLQADLIQLAYTAVLMSESGKPVPPHILYGMKEYESFLIEAKEQFDRYNLAAENIIRGTQRINFELGLANANDALGALEIGIDWKSLNVEAFESMVGLTSAGSPLDDLLSADYGDSVRGISNALTTGIARGEGIEKIVKRMTQAANIGFDRSTRIARTEVNRAYRMATHAQYRESGVVVGFRRLVYKPTACFACLMLDGEYSDITKELEDHVMGKCTSVPCLRKNDRIEWETGREWFEKLDPEEQRRIMGAGRYEAWKDGKIKDLRQFVTIKPNPIWGGSPTIIPLKDIKIGNTIKPIIPLLYRNPYETAKTLRRKHYGFYKRNKDLPINLLNKGIRRLNLQIEAHRKKIEKWTEVINNKNTLIFNARKAYGLLLHWHEEIVNFAQLIDILDGIIKEKESGAE